MIEYTRVNNALKIIEDKLSVIDDGGQFPTAVRIVMETLAAAREELRQAHYYLNEATRIYKDAKFPLVERVHCLNQQSEASRDEALVEAANLVRDYMVYTGPGGIDPEPVQKKLAEAIHRLKDTK